MKMSALVGSLAYFHYGGRHLFVNGIIMHLLHRRELDRLTQAERWEYEHLDRNEKWDYLRMNSDQRWKFEHER